MTAADRRPPLLHALRSPLARRYALLLSGLVGTLLLLSGAVFTHLAHSEALAAAAALQQGQARHIAAEVNAVLRGLRDGLQAAAAKYELDAAGGADALRVESAWLLRQHPALHELRWIAPDGRERLVLVRYGLSTPDPRTDWRSDPTWRAALDAGQATGPTYWRDGYEPHVAIASAARPDGGGVRADVSLKLLSELLGQARLPQGGMAYVVDAGGALLAHPDLAQVLGRAAVAQRPQVQRALSRAGDGDGSGAGVGADGQPVLASSLRLDDLGWVVLVEQPEREALRPARAALERSLLLLALGLLAAVAASAWLAWRLVRPIQALEAGAARLAEGRLDTPVATLAPIHGDELGRLAERFDAMAARLQGVLASQERRIAERTAELAQANEAKTRFLAAAAHDLRQPVHALSLFAGRLQSERLSRRAAATAADVARSARALDELVAALLDLSRIDVGAQPVQPRAMPLQALFDRLALQAAPSADARGLRWRTVSTRAWVHTDPVLLERIALNLVANALRYTRRGGVLIGARPRGDAVELWIVDTGVGIAPDHLGRVFDEFFRAPEPGTGSASGETGLGMGLAIVARLARLLGHAVDLRSVPGRGTVATLRLPRAAPPPAAAAGEAASPLALPGVTLEGRRVLVVDDDRAARDAMAGTLARWGCRVQAAADGVAALALASAERPDAVLCDLFLADGKCGLAVLDLLRGKLGAGLRCAIVTAGGPEPTLAAARASGHPLAFKPLSPARLRALLESLLD